MSKYVTTNIRLTEDMMRNLKLRCIYEKKRIAQLVREALENYMGKRDEHLEDFSFDKDPIINIIGLCKTGIKDCSINHDKYLYKRR